jgi:hypothetical protein
MVAGGLISLQTEPEKHNLWGKVVNTISFSIFSGSVPLFVKLYLKLKDSVPMVERLKSVLNRFDSLEARLLPSLYFIKEMKAFHEEWIEWRDSIRVSGFTSQVERNAWTLLAEAYLGEESRKLKERYVLTNTNQYTRLVSDAGRSLEEHLLSYASPKSQRIIRYHITGMLPEEFYNGSQIEFTSNNSQPIFFGHKWENYQDFYASEYQGHSQRSIIRRCIIVRESDLRRPEMCALSTLADLQEQTSLSIIKLPRSVVDDLPREIDSVQQRLFRKCSPEQQQEHRTLIESMLGKKDYNYWPIARTEDCKKDIQEQSSNDDQWLDLVDVFSTTFHGNKPDDASFCVLNETAADAIKNDTHLRKCFKPGWIPEIALFGGIGNGEEPEVWYFGILGHWRPFTPDIELRFLTSEETKRLYHLFINKVYEKGASKGKLQSLQRFVKSGRKTDS